LIPLQLEAAKNIIGNFDAIFYAGDFGNAINRYDYWFTHSAALFASLQGKAKVEINGDIYKGAELIQTIPIIPAFGNHDVPDFGQIKINPRVPEWQFFNNIFSLPLDETSRAPYYSIKMGKQYLIVLPVARVYQSDFSYVPIEEGSEQYQWLLNELHSEEFQEAEFRVVMMHHPIYTLNPDPFNFICTTKEKFFLIKNINSLAETLGSLFEKYKIDLVFNGHDHIWNHFVSSGGVHYLSSCQAVAENKNNWLLKKCSNGLDPVFPNKNQFRLDGKLVPYPVGPGAVFSVLDTKTKQVISYFSFFQGTTLQCIEFDAFTFSRAPQY
ncbi:MAG: metallophosphoesterase, partial [Simkaniaceae bacterium]|nr:metallophosphoesterase [Simkaniaceae bacterium]